MHIGGDFARWMAGLAALAGLLGGCDRPSPTPTPSSQPIPTVIPVDDVQRAAPAPPALFVAGYDQWTRAEAAERLADTDAAVSAAVRLVRLAERQALCVPPTPCAAFVARLAVVRLSDSRVALGFADESGRRLRAPVLIAMDGEVTLPATGFEEEVAVLHVSDDSDVFPHLIVTPTRVLWVADDVTSALVGKRLPHVAFSWVPNDGFPYIAMRLSGAVGESSELARYAWDPYEFAFMGPLADKLPDPPAGRFELDLEASKALVPVGGEIPEPEPLAQPQDQPQPELPPF